MIIGDLCDEYAVLVSQNKAPAYGYDNVNASYGLVIVDDGTLIRVRPLGDFSGKKPVNIIPVPARFPRSSGIVANFLCDNVTYLLGCDTKGNAKRSAQAFQACQGSCRLRRMRLLLEGAAMADRPTTYGGRGMEVVSDDELRPGI